MIGNALTSFFDNLSTKTKNPFLGTFTIVWLCRNWELVFALFNFDDSYTLESKITFLSERIKYETFWSELGWNIFWTFLVLILTYFLINITRYITNLFENRITPWIYRISAPKQITLLKEYEKLESIHHKNRQEFRLERTNRINTENERDRLQDKVKELNNEIKNLENQLLLNKESKTDAPTEQKVEELAQNMKKTFDQFDEDDIWHVIESALSGLRIDAESYNEEIAELIQLGMIELNRSNEDGRNLYTISLLGNEWLRKSR